MASASSPASASASTSRVEVEELDASTKVSTLFFIFSAAVWLVVASLLGFIAAVQLVQPSFLDGCAWLTHGRIVPMAQNALVYGWGFNAAFAVLIWVMTRLSRSPAPGWGPTVVGGLFWNAGVKLGLTGIMIGDTTGYALLEMPNYAAPLLFLAYAIIGSRIIVIFSRRRGEGVFAAQWYALAALFWFPWLFTIARVSIGMDILRGPAQAIAGAWYSHNVYSLFPCTGGVGDTLLSPAEALGSIDCGVSDGKTGVLVVRLFRKLWRSGYPDGWSGAGVGSHLGQKRKFDAAGATLHHCGEFDRDDVCRTHSRSYWRAFPEFS